MPRPQDHPKSDESTALNTVESDLAPDEGVSSTRDPSPHDERVAELMSHTIDVPILASAVEQQQAPDAADTLERLEEKEEEASTVLELMEIQAAAKALAEMEHHLAVRVIEDLVSEGKSTLAANLLQLMAPDDAADLLQVLDERHRQTLLGSMPPESARDLHKLIRYDRESAGGIMTTDFLTLRGMMTIPQAIEFVRSSNVSDHITDALVIDENDRLVGIVALYQLLLARTGNRIEEIMQKSIKTVPPDMDREQVAHEFDRYDYSMLPVVDANDRLLGIVTVDDVIDIIRAEQTEDVQKTVGAGAGEAVYSRLTEKFRGRLPWLLVNLFTSSIAALIVFQFDQLIAQLAILAVLMPVIANQAGNAGQQSLAVTLRGIVLEEVRRERVLPLILRETVLGMINGLLAGLLVCVLFTVLGGLIGPSAWKVGVVAASSMSMALAVGCFTGTSLPLLMRRIGVDPATASTIFLTMITDSFSFLVFLGTALLLSDWLGLV